MLLYLLTKIGGYEALDFSWKSQIIMARRLVTMVTLLINNDPPVLLRISMFHMDVYSANKQNYKCNNILCITLYEY